MRADWPLIRASQQSKYIKEFKEKLDRIGERKVLYDWASRKTLSLLIATYIREQAHAAFATDIDAV